MRRRSFLQGLLATAALSWAPIRAAGRLVGWRVVQEGSLGYEDRDGIGRTYYLRSTLENTDGERATVMACMDHPMGHWRDPLDGHLEVIEAMLRDHLDRKLEERIPPWAWQ